MGSVYPARATNRADLPVRRRSRHAQVVGLVTWIATVLTIVLLATLVIYMAHHPVIVPSRPAAASSAAPGAR
jgi:hypothetical protein